MKTIDTESVSSGTFAPANNSTKNEIVRRSLKMEALVRENPGKFKGSSTNLSFKQQVMQYKERTLSPVADYTTEDLEKIKEQGDMLAKKIEDHVSPPA